MIYVMGEAPTGVVKIGTAINPVERLKQIQAGYPRPLRLLLALPGGRETETYLHRCFHERRVSEREWFEFGEDDAVAAVVAAVQDREEVADGVAAAPDLVPLNAPALPSPRPTPTYDCTPVDIWHWNVYDGYNPVWVAHCQAHPGIQRALGGSCDEKPTLTEWPDCLGTSVGLCGRVPRWVKVHPGYDLDFASGTTRLRWSNDPIVEQIKWELGRVALPSEVGRQRQLDHVSRCVCVEPEGLVP